MLAFRLEEKGNLDEIDIEVPYKIAAAPDGSPSATSSAATFGYHYTLDHLLLLDPPRRDRQPSPSPAGSSPVMPR